MTTDQKMRDSVKIITDAIALLEKHGEDASALREMLDINSVTVFATAGILKQLDSVLAAQILHLDARMKECPLDEEFFSTNIGLIAGLMLTGIASLSNPQWDETAVKDIIRKSATMTVMPRTKFFGRITQPAMDYSLMSSPTEAYSEAIANLLTNIAERTGDPNIKALGENIKKIANMIIEDKIDQRVGMEQIRELIDASPLGDKFKDFMAGKINPLDQ